MCLHIYFYMLYIRIKMWSFGPKTENRISNGRKLRRPRTTPTPLYGVHNKMDKKRKHKCSTGNYVTPH